MADSNDTVADSNGSSDPIQAATRSRSSSLSKNPDQSDSVSEMTLLWGIWELWCDTSGMKSPALSGASSPGSKQMKAGPTLRLRPDTWLDSVRSISLFDSAEGFWSLHKCTLLPSQLPHGVSYYVFRKNIAPMWEHEANRRGGKWVIQFTQDTPVTSATATSSVSSQPPIILPIDYAWLHLCLAVIGEQLPCKEEEICGVTVSCNKPSTTSSGTAAVGDKKPSRNKDAWKLCLWTRNAEDAEAQMRIAKAVRELLNSIASGSETSYAKSSRELTQKDREYAHKNSKIGETIDRIFDLNKRSSTDYCTRPVQMSNTVNGLGLAGTKFAGHGSGAAQRTMYYMVHREIMQAKDYQNANKDSTVSGTWCKPRYVI